MKKCYPCRTRISGEPAKSNAMGLLAFIIMFFLFSFSFSAPKPPQAAIASAHPLATKAGMDILKHGGNAFDAAVAVASTLAVVEPYSSGVGGGGFWLLYDASKKQINFIDSRETAPGKARKKMYLDRHGRVIPGLSLNGPLSAAIPGEPAAFDLIAKRYGQLTLAEDLTSAITQAEKGFPVDTYYLKKLKFRDRLKQLQKYPTSTAIFLKDNHAPELGDLIIQKNLAKTLRLLAEKGRAGFYQGETANKLIASVQRAGGIWTFNDLKYYQVKTRQPLYGSYKNIRIATAPPPSAGGIAIITMLNILSRFDLEKLPPARRVHDIIEAMRLAYWDRSRYIGDSDYIHVPVAALTSMAHANTLASHIKKNQATSSQSLGTVTVFNDSSDHTTHFSIIDQQGNMVAATLTINYVFGSAFVAGKTGVLLNDEMDDFSTRPGAPNVFGLVGSVPNRIEPGKRPLSSMSPTFLFSPDRIGILGTPGGSRIPTMVLLGILDFIKGKQPESWVSFPRFHMQYLPDRVYFEKNAFSDEEQKQLIKMGYDLKVSEDLWGNMQAIEWDRLQQSVLAAADPRGIGLASVSRATVGFPNKIQQDQ